MRDIKLTLAKDPESVKISGRECESRLREWLLRVRAEDFYHSISPFCFGPL